VPADTPILVQFDRPVVPQSVVGRFTVDRSIANCNLTAAFSAAPDAPCSIVWLNGNTVFVLRHPGAILAPDKQYTFTLQGGFRDPSGAVNTVDHSWSITTATAPVVKAVSPGDGASDVPVDAPMIVDFTNGMDAATTAAAIHLEPPVPGTRVVPNTKDHSRFMVLPGSLLQSRVTYHLAIDRNATDLHGQQLAAAVSLSFTTGGVAPTGHGVVIAARSGEGGTEVLLTALTPLEDGLPIASEVALSSPRCDVHPSCGAAPFGSPLYTYVTAALSPDDRWLAVVEADQTMPATPTSVVVIQAATGVVRAAFSAASLPSWSPDGSTLAYAAGSSIALYRPLGGASVTLPPGGPLLAPPEWGPLGELLVLSSAGVGAGGPEVELADAVVGARYPLPGITGTVTHPVVSPDGAELVVYRGGASQGTWLVPIGANAGPPRRLDPDLMPLGFTDPGTLIAVATAPSGSTSLVRVSISGDEQIGLPGPPGAEALATLVVSSSGSRLGYLAQAPNGAVNAYVENADGSNPTALTRFAPGTLEAVAITLSG
jgi:Bacterial Ig-like domain/WD40-like Beta Propeller Repeat